MAIRKLGSTFVVPGRVTSSNIRTPHFTDLSPYPALPIKRNLGDQMWDGRWEDGVVIEAHEPVGIYKDSNGRNWLVPCVGTTAVTVTYAQNDIDQAVEDIDNLGNAVTATGASTATIPSVLPLGITIHPIVRNFSYTTGIQLISDVYENYDINLNSVIGMDLDLELPYVRWGNNRMGDLDSGEILIPGDIRGGTLSASARPYFTSAQQMATGAATASEFASAELTISGGSPADGDTYVLTFPHAGDGGFSITATGRTASPDADLNEYLVGVSAAADATALHNLLASKLPPWVAVSTNPSSGVVLVTSAVVGNEGNFTAVESMDNTTITDDSTDATDAANTLHTSGDVTSSMNTAYQIGKVLEVRNSLAELGGDSTTAFGQPSLNLAVTTPGLGLSGRDTGGVPAEFYVTGNSATGNNLPSDYSDAGVVKLRIW